MKLSGLHLLLTYQCTFECDHCFVWGSPWQSGTMTLQKIRETLRQAKDMGTIEWIYFEGGEPLLYYPILLAGAREAVAGGWRVGIVTNSYWANDLTDALEWLKPFAGLVEDLSISSDLYHWDEKVSQQVKNARAAADMLGIPVGFISVAQPEGAAVESTVGQLPQSGPEVEVMVRGRAVEKLAARMAGRPWAEYAACPHEDLREPGRLHLDPLGNVQICQGISLGNIFRTALAEICAGYLPDGHPIIGPLLAGGPAELVRRTSLPHEETYADACHLCYEARCALRARFPDILGPDQMYGVYDKREQA